MRRSSLTRRQFLERGALAGAALAAPSTLLEAAFGAVVPLKSYQADLLSYIPPIVPVADGGTVNLAIRQVQRRVHPAAQPTTVWSYELATGDPRVSGAAGTWIGPILALDAESEITVNYAMSGGISKHLLEASIDRDMLDPYVAHGPDVSDTRFMTHLHGAFVDGDNDGNPFATEHEDEWAPGQTETKVYPAQDRAALIWYHQHAHGITHLNVYAGLAGGYLLRDDLDTGLNDNELGLPANVYNAAGQLTGIYEVPLVIQDRIFQATRTTLDLFYPPAPWIPEFFGDTMCVNGAVEPFLEVEPRLYRFRIINGCNARFLNLDWKPGSLSGARPPMYVIGSDGGLVPKPLATPNLIIAPGERYDILVDFTPLAGERVNLANKSPFPAPVVNPAGPLPRIMQFRVTKPLITGNRPEKTFDPSATLTTDTPAAALKSADVDGARYHTFEEVMGARGPLGAVINGKSFEGRPIKNPVPMTGYPFDKDNPVGVEEIVRDGDIEDWVFANTTADTHPLHMHLVQFGVVERRPFDVAGYLAALAAARDGAAGAPPLLSNGTIDPTPFLLPGAGTPVSDAEKGWKDTVQMHPGEVTKIRAKFDLKENYTAPQDFVYHCHILEHESNSMMRPYRVVSE